ncbi:unnamed protein product [Lactuca virosa]|uniref:Leucine-rich repeat-containing N-terminal plant-type domain-containing protein n=1 Tax=Lactuca virosa TaxID=75947 RepID=A0AAU9LSK3_9ASTR|nr:unnamed protein product [Lactuca virosa]
MASFSSLLLLLLLNVLMTFKTGDGGDMSSMEDDELSGLFEVMGSLLDDPTWAQVHPQPCTDTPWPGVQCELMVQEDGDGQQDYNPTIFHVTKIHIGTDILTPPCKPTATLSQRGLTKLPYLKTLSLFNCFTLSPFSLTSSLFENSSLSALEHLALVSNPSLHGSIPSSLGHIQSLRVLSLSQNKLTGEIPQQICGLVNLQQLDLSYNQLTGSVPQEIGGLKSLTIFDLSYNMLEGQLPSSFGQLQSLQKIDLGFNDITARVPCHSRQSYKYSNSLNGTVPSDLGSLPNLEQLNLSQNQLSGQMLVSEEFINRIGMRLDIRGNNGLCIKNITSTDVKSSSCISARSRTGGNKSSWDEGGECGRMNSTLFQSNRCPRIHHGYGFWLDLVFLLMLFLLFFV